MVGKTGSIARASEQLYLSPQSISVQLGDLENSLGAVSYTHLDVYKRQILETKFS